MEVNAAKAYPMLTSLGIDIQNECIGCPLLGVLEAKLDRGLTELEDKSEFVRTSGTALLEEADTIEPEDEELDFTGAIELSSEALHNYLVNQATKILGDAYNSKQAAMLLQKSCSGNPAKFIMRRWGPVICKSPSRATAATSVHGI